MPVEDELHIAGVVVHAAPKLLSEVEHALGQWPGARVHAASQAGKLVVTLELPTAGEVTDAVLRMQSLPGVLGAALVYQWGDTVAAMNQEMPDAEAGLH